MSANWDVKELEARKDEIIRNNLLKIDLKGEFGSTTVTRPTFTTVLYPAEGTNFNIDYFVNTHMPLAMKHWAQYGLKGYDVVQFDTASKQKPKYAAQCIFKWDQPDSVEKATQGPEAKIV